MRTALDVVQVASDMMLRRASGNVTMKGDRDMSSDLDVEVEREVRRFLRERTPDIGFLGEEEGASGQGEKTWVLDPIDGTANFLRGLPLCGVALGLVENNRPTLGVISLPFLNESYSAIVGDGAYSARRRLSVRATSSLDEAIVGIGDYAIGPDAATKNAGRIVLTGQLAANVQRIRMVGSAATDLAWLAAGRLDASITLSNHPWDMVAGAIIAKEAGASVIDIDGTDYTLGSSNVIACGPGITEPLLALIRESLALPPSAAVPI
jgi:myo-inositol-1(or 4)-monophosphatase